MSRIQDKRKVLGGLEDWRIEEERVVTSDIDHHPFIGLNLRGGLTIGAAKSEYLDSVASDSFVQAIFGQNV